MTTTPDFGIRPPRPLIKLAAGAALPATALALAARLALPELPPDQRYTTGFAPWWITVIGLACGAVLLAATSRRPIRRTVTLSLAGVAITLLLWSGAGVVLDGFRAFFAATGIPAGDFAIVDWPGMACRGLSLISAGLLAAVSITASRSTAPRCPACGRTVKPIKVRHRRFGYAAALLGLPYPALKLYWWAGGTIARPEIFHEGDFPAMELAAMVAGVVVSLALVQTWGRHLPRWMPLTAAGGAGAILISMGSLSIFGTIAQLIGITDGPIDFSTTGMWMVGAVYGGWALFGLALLGAGGHYAAVTARRCPQCPR